MTPHLRSRTSEIARAAAALEAGERLAHRVASRQASLAREPRMTRFLALQVRQEAFHARVFAAVSNLLAPRVAAANPAAPALAALQARLEADLDAGDLWSSLIGLQVALEGLGGAVLGELEGAVAAHVPALAPLRRALARQEAAHHAFGGHRVAWAIASGELPGRRLGAAVRDYDCLAAELLAGCAELLEGFSVSLQAYAGRAAAARPAWFREAVCS